MINDIYDIIIEKGKDKKILILSGNELSDLSETPLYKNLLNYESIGNIEKLFSNKNDNLYGVWNWILNKRAELKNNHPNINHYSLNKLEQYYKNNFALITQNIDGLHSKAGSYRLIEFNGNLYTEKLIHDNEINNNNSWKILRIDNSDLYVMPNILFDNEKVEKSISIQSKLLAQSADICIVVGVTKEQDSFTDLPMIAKKYNDAYVIEINNKESIVAYSDLYIKEKLENILPILVKLIIGIEEGVSFKT